MSRVRKRRQLQWLSFEINLSKAYLLPFITKARIRHCGLAQIRINVVDSLGYPVKGACWSG